MNGVTNEKMCINTNRQTETHPERETGRQRQTGREMLASQMNMSK